MIRTTCFIGGLAALSTLGCVGNHDSEDPDNSASRLSYSMEACLARVPDEAAGLFVSSTTGSDTLSCGSRNSPCKTISKGMERASGLKSVIYLERGTYSEQVVMTAGMRLEGGWATGGSGWIPDCNVDATKIVVTESDTAVSVKDLNGAASLAFVSVENQTIAEPGQSLYGVFARGASTKLTLEAVGVFVADAGAGANGNAGAWGHPGGAIDPAGCSPGNAGPGTPAKFDWTYPRPGEFSSSGYSPANGRDGNDGTSGENGTKPTLLATCVRGCTKLVSSTSCPAAPDSCGTEGKAGCGGEAGKGGGAGMGGGSSIALYVWDATVSVSGSSLQASNAGRGGTGGPGGRGGDGGFGVSGLVPTSACTKCTFVSGTGGGFYTGVTEIGRGTAGGPGGVGGPGTDGSPGTNGSGGFSYAVYRNASAQVTLDATVSAHGDAGGTNSGADPGSAGDINIASGT